MFQCLFSNAGRAGHVLVRAVSAATNECWGERVEWCVCEWEGRGESETIKRKARHRSWSKAGKKCYRCLEYTEMSVVLCEALH